MNLRDYKLICNFKSRERSTSPPASDSRTPAPAPPPPTLNIWTLCTFLGTVNVPDDVNTLWPNGIFGNTNFSRIYVSNSLRLEERRNM